MAVRFPAILNVDDFATVNRRGLLRGLGASALVTTSGSFFTRSAASQTVFSAYPFTLGVASGDPAPDGFVIWTKIAPKPLERGAGMPNLPLLEDESMVNIAQIEGQLRASSLRKITELVEKHPEETLSIMRGWMVQENS